MADSKVKVKVTLDFERDLPRLIQKGVNDEVGRVVVEKVKEYVAAGVSPVKGEGKFEPYKNPIRYPGDRKSRLPVNLYLTGRMLAALKWWDSPRGLTIGFKDPSSTEHKIAETHNEGTQDNVPQRKFLPTAQGDEFTERITNAIRQVYAKFLSDIIRLSK